MTSHHRLLLTLLTASLALFGCDEQKPSTSSKQKGSGEAPPHDAPKKPSIKNFDFHGKWENIAALPSRNGSEPLMFSFEIDEKGLHLDDRVFALEPALGSTRPTLCMKLKTGVYGCDAFKIEARSPGKILVSSGFYDDMTRPISMHRASEPTKK